MITLKSAKHSSARGMEGKRITLGIAGAAAVTMAFTLLLSFAVTSEKITIQQLTLFSYMIWIVSSAVGSIIGINRTQQGKLIKAGIITAGYILILTAISLAVFSGTSSGIFAGIVCSIIGGLTGCACKAATKIATIHRWK
ncbi:MAG: TIGR04086 family membrane protein [Oscillospiraceae bacterium]|nr:TIGR04086 family membrane protein [Oscillospiraceae bacterium]